MTTAKFDELAAKFGVFDSGHKVLFLYIPKVACTVLKATLVMNSPRRDAYLASGTPIHDFIAEERRAGINQAAIGGTDIYRFTVLREPAARIVSAYLNKFASRGKHEAPGITRDKNHAIQSAQEMAEIPADLARGITFEEFVHFLAQARDAELNLHWTPQVRFVGNDLTQYDHVGCFERLADTFDLLEQRFGYQTERDSAPHLAGSRNNTTRYNPEVKLADPHRWLPAELRTLRLGYPPADSFLTPALREIIRTRFAEDAALHEAACAMSKKP